MDEPRLVENTENIDIIDHSLISITQTTLSFEATENNQAVTKSFVESLLEND